MGIDIYKGLRLLDNLAEEIAVQKNIEQQLRKKYQEILDESDLIKKSALTQSFIQTVNLGSRYSTALGETVDESIQILIDAKDEKLGPLKAGAKRLKDKFEQSKSKD